MHVAQWDAKIELVWVYDVNYSILTLIYPTRHLFMQKPTTDDFVENERKKKRKNHRKGKNRFRKKFREESERNRQWERVCERVRFQVHKPLVFGPLNSTHSN